MHLREEKIRLILRKLAALNQLTPDNVVEKARDPKSPLHCEFEWDDTIAAQKWRLTQARTIIARTSIFVVHREVEVPVQEFVHDPDLEKEQGYVPFLGIKDDPEKASRFIARELVTVRTIVEKCINCAKVCGMDKELHDLSSQVNQLIGLAPKAAAQSKKSSKRRK